MLHTKKLEYYENEVDITYKPYVILSYDFKDSNTNLDKIMRCEFDKVCYPNQALTIVTDRIKENLSESQVKERLEKYQSEEASPSHSNLLTENLEANKVYKYDNVHYYDVNKAYASRLAKAFPEIDKFIEREIAKGKADPHYKQYSKDLFNYTVGCFRYKGKNRFEKIFPNIDPMLFNNFRNWIVKDIDTQVNIKMNKLDGDIIYLNTDGFIIQNPEVIEEGDVHLGGFKKEIIDNNELWFYRYEDPDNYYNSYSIMQWFENGTKIIKAIGGFIQDEELVSRIDLSQNKTVRFKTIMKNNRKIITEYKEN